MYTEAIELGVTALVAMGGGLGLSKLFQVRSTNKKITSESDKTDIEASAIFVGATAVFSDTILKMLHEAQRSADNAAKQADLAVREAHQVKEELAFLRQWIIGQGLVPPVRTL